MYKKLTKKLELKDFRNAYFFHLIESGASKFSEIIPNVFLRQRLGELTQRGLITKTLLEEQQSKMPTNLYLKIQST